MNYVRDMGSASTRLALTLPFPWGRGFRLCHRAVGVLRHPGEVNLDLAVLEHPAIGEPHLRFTLRSLHRDCLDDHQRLRLLGLAPEGDFRLQILDAEDAVEVLAQLGVSAKVAGLLLEAADQHG